MSPLGAATPATARGCRGIRTLFASGTAALLAALALLGPPAASAAGSGGIDPARAVPPQLLMIHGGSFLFEDPTFEARTAGAAIAAGFTPHYLTYPHFDLPAAVRAARGEAALLRARYGAGAVYAYGTSAGGTLAALLAGDGLVAGAVAKAPISDLLGWTWPLGTYGADYYERIAAGPSTARRLSPLRRPARRPLLVMHGRGDGIVPLAMSRAYASKFKRVHLWVVPGGHHTERSRPELLHRALGWLAVLAG